MFRLFFDIEIRRHHHDFALPFSHHRLTSSHHLITEAAPPKDDAGGADTPTREPPRRSLTAEDLTEEDRTARLSGPAPEVEPEVSTFLKDGDLAKYEDMLARRGVNTMDALTAPWLRVAEGFLVDKVSETRIKIKGKCKENMGRFLIFFCFPDVHSADFILSYFYVYDSFLKFAFLYSCVTHVTSAPNRWA